MDEHEDGFVTTASEVVSNFQHGVNLALDVITSDKTIGDDARADLIKLFEGIDDQLDEARNILRKESSESE